MVYRPRIPWGEGRWGPLEKELCYTNTFLSCSSFSQAFPKEIYDILSCDCAGRKNIIRLFRGLLNPEVTLIPGDLKCHCDQSSGYGGQLINGVSAQVRLSGPSGSSNPSLYFFPKSRCIIGMDILSNWQNPHIGSNENNFFYAMPLFHRGIIWKFTWQSKIASRLIY